MRLSVWAMAPQSWTELLTLARHIEATGWDGLWLPDGPGRPLEAWAALGGLSAEVPRLRLGSLVSVAGDRHPAVLAKLAVTADHLSGGRVVLGLGAGGGPPPAGERLSRLDEACQVIKALLTQERTTFRGRHFHLEEAPLEPKAVQQPLPLLVAGGGERVTLRIAARWADQWNAWGDVDTIRSKLGVLDRHCAAVGRDPRQIRRSAQALVAVGGRPATDAPFPTLAAEEIPAYESTGLDEFVVPDLLLGDGRAKLDALDAIRRLCR